MLRKVLAQRHRANMQKHNDFDALLIKQKAELAIASDQMDILA